jgi:hypothetical protein
MVISHTGISTCTIVNSSCEVVGSFMLEDFNDIYKLIPPIFRLDVNFIKEFIKKNVEKEEVQMDKLIKE